MVIVGYKEIFTNNETTYIKKDQKILAVLYLLQIRS